VKAWSDAQNQRTRQYLDKLPDRAAIEKQLTEWYAKTSPSYSSLVSRPGILFAMKFQPPKQQPLLVTLASADDLKSEKVVLDPNALDAKGTTTIDWFVPSLDGKSVAVSLSKGGSEDGTLHFYERRGKSADRARPISNGGWHAWNGMAAEFITRVSRKGGAGLIFLSTDLFSQTRQVAAQDTYSIGKDFPRIADRAASFARREAILATVANGDGDCALPARPNGSALGDGSDRTVQRSDQGGTPGA
jgi:prolyl oligopeptidase